MAMRLAAGVAGDLTFEGPAIGDPAFDGRTLKGAPSPASFPARSAAVLTAAAMRVKSSEVNGSKEEFILPTYLVSQSTLGMPFTHLPGGLWFWQRVHGYPTEPTSHLFFLPAHILQLSLGGAVLSLPGRFHHSTQVSNDHVNVSASKDTSHDIFA